MKYYPVLTEAVILPNALIQSSETISLKTGKKKILISSMGRSGSTWMSDLINHKLDFKEVFEPFFPARVRESESFGYYRYLDGSSKEHHLEQVAKLIVNGELDNSWVNSGNKDGYGDSILIKSIRSNLMLTWLKEHFQELKIIFLIRDPFEVAQSWMRLGWGKIPFQNLTDLNVILGQKTLLTNFPELSIWSDRIKEMSNFEMIVLEWCILNYVPLRQQSKQPDLFLPVNYNEIVVDPSHLKRIFDFIEEDFSSNTIKNIEVKSRTTFHGVNAEFRVSDEEKNRGLKIIESFGFDWFNIKPVC